MRYADHSATRGGTEEDEEFKVPVEKQQRVEVEPKAREERDYSVRAVERVCSILNLLQESIDGVSLIDVGEITELPKSTAFRFLWTLQRHRYVERDPETGLYRLGLGFIGMQSRQLEVLRIHTRPWLEKLRGEFDETLNLGVLDGSAIIYLDIVESHRGVRLAARTGERDPLHATALGKAIAAHLPEQRVREILTHVGMAPRTQNTITDLDDFLAELTKVQRLGYALDDGENELDGRCVAVPLQGTRLPAAISFSAPASRFPLQDIKRVAAALQDAAESIATSPVGDDLVADLDASG